jgi:hypothetical protein
MKGKKRDIKIATTSFEKMALFRYLGNDSNKYSFIQEKLKRRLNSGNASYRSAQNILSYRLLSNNVKIIIYKTIILPLVL